MEELLGLSLGHKRQSGIQEQSDRGDAKVSVWVSAKEVVEEDSVFPAAERKKWEALQSQYEERRGLVWNERSVPATQTARVLGFGGLAVGMLAGGIVEAFNSNKDASSSLLLSQGNSERLASTLCRMRGAALKLGQILSIQEDSVLPKHLSIALERARQNADIMPKTQLAQVLKSELGEKWEENFQAFDYNPVAAASLGQVHKGTLKDGRVVAMKVQFPGVATSIDSDLNNLKALATATGIFPKGLFIENIMEVMKEELQNECDYLAEAQHQDRFKELLLSHSDNFFVPAVIHDMTTKHVLTTEWAPGIPIDKTVGLPQRIRNQIGSQLLELSLAELFKFRYMQTDPNYSNYLYDVRRNRISLIDFGAARTYEKRFVDEYLNLVWSASNRDRQGIIDASLRLGFLTGSESQQMVDAHVDAGLEMGRPFQSDRPFDFASSLVSAKIRKHGGTFANERLTPPPKEVYSLHRRLSGAYMICIKLKAFFECREMLAKSREEYLLQN